MRKTGVIVLALALGSLIAVPLSAQSPPQTDQAILDELRQIRQLLERLTTPGAAPSPPQAGARATLSLKTGHMLGSTEAPLTMVEFTDLQCPFCRQFHATTFEQLKAAYIDTGKLRYFSRDFPIVDLHPLSAVAARASRCAGDQGKFWEMRHAILNTETLTRESFFKQADVLKLDVTRFSGCVEDAGRFQSDIGDDMRDGAHAGVTGTPSFVLGRTKGDTLDGVLVLGAQPYGAFDAQLKALLR